MITELRQITKKGLEDERRKTMDRQVVVITFRDAYVKEKGVLHLVNEFNQVLANKQSIKPIEYVQTGWNQVGTLIVNIADMMVLKDFAVTRKSVMMIQSGQERVMGQYVTEKEKDKFYKKMKQNARKKELGEYDEDEDTPELSPEEAREKRDKMVENIKKQTRGEDL